MMVTNSPDAMILSRLFTALIEAGDETYRGQATLDLNVTFLNAATTDVHADAQVLRSSRTLVFTSVDVRDAAGTLVAVEREALAPPLGLLTESGPIEMVIVWPAERPPGRRELLLASGAHAVREYYINDAGAQVDVLARSAFLRYREALGESVGEIPEGLYPGDYLKPVGAALAKALVDC